MDEKLLKIRDFASKAHGDQRRKYVDEMYIRHPERVMYLCVEYTEDRPVLAAALLHDVLEDTPVTEAELRNFLEEVMGHEEAVRTLSLVVDLTDIYIKSAYPKLNRRARRQKEAHRLSGTQPDAQTIKYADIIDNATDIIHDPDFARVYLREARHMISVMDKGHETLRLQAEHVVEQCIEQLETAIRKEGVE